jgi:Zn finger protein HypA/HybF involved in hydrogenase expression
MKFRDMMQSADLEILRSTLQDVPEFAFDVLQAFANFADAPLRGHCHSCGPNQIAETLQARCTTCGKRGISLTN